jgi:hypothetical protein
MSRTVIVILIYRRHNPIDNIVNIDRASFYVYRWAIKKK